ncbi:MAG: hypothetical protein ACRCSS_09550, partial [Shewanella sp.]
ILQLVDELRPTLQTLQRPTRRHRALLVILQVSRGAFTPNAAMALLRNPFTSMAYAATQGLQWTKAHVHRWRA